jgi:hypothetical protein
MPPEQPPQEQARGAFARDLSDSAAAFRDIVWPRIAPICGGGEIVPMEGVKAESGAFSLFAGAVDRLCGIDAWQLCAEHGMRGIATRIQFGGKPWASFTMRERRATGAPTELEKRARCLAQARRRWLLPALTVQAYVSARGPGGRLLYAAVAYTEDLVSAASAEGGPFERRRNPADGNDFLVLWVDWLRASGVVVKELAAEGEGAGLARPPRPWTGAEAAA